MTAALAGIELSRVSKTFDGPQVLSDISFHVGNGEIVALTGPSGAGKTTISRIISGVEFSSAGRVSIGGVASNSVPARKRGVAHMFESFALYPHFTVFQNVAFPLREAAAWKGRLQSEIQKRVQDVLDLTEIGHLGARLPSQLSGGQKQRVALCRALVQEARAYVLDEPISHLDAKLRNRLRGDIRRRLIETGRPALWCTPDAMDAIAVADRVVVLLGGKIAQIATPDELFKRPASISVATLVGDPPINVLDARIEGEGDATRLNVEGVRFKLPAAVAHALVHSSRGADVQVGVPPTAMSLADSGAANALAGKVYTWEPFGKNVILTLLIGGQAVKVKSPNIPEMPVDADVHIQFDPSSLLYFRKDNGSRIEVNDLQESSPFRVA